MMTDIPAQLKEGLSRGGITLMFDTNALLGRSFLERCDGIARLNEGRPEAPISLRVSAVAHVEKLFHLRQEFRDDHEPAVIVRVLAKKGLVIEAFGQHHAEHLASMLGREFPTRADWYAFKKRFYLQRLGLAPNYEISASGRRCGATVDWLIAGQADASDAWLVTSDQGAEFGPVERKVPFESLVSVLEEVMAG